MSLADHWSDSKYLGEGWHNVAVKEFDTFFYNSGAPGVAFTVADRAGRIVKHSFNLLPQCQYNLAQFAAACGFAKEDCAAYEPEQPNSHMLLIGRHLQVLVEKEEKGDKSYSVVSDFAKLEDEAPTFQRPEAQTQPVAPPTEPEVKGQGTPLEDDNIPF